MGLTEEMEMFLEVADWIAGVRRAEAEKGRDLSPARKGKVSGSTTENVIRNHLLKRGFNMSSNRVFLSPLKIEIDLFLLHSGVDNTKPVYHPEQVDTVFEIKNNAVADQTSRTRANFDRIKATAKNMRFAFVVLSERITYPYRVTRKGLGYPVFELISRRRSAGRWMESRSEILAEHSKIIRTGERAMWETGKWKELLNYLRNKRESANL